MDSFLERLVNEQKELNEKLTKLNSFIDGANFSSIEPIQQSLLKIQSSSMKSYNDILVLRISHLNKTVTAKSCKQRVI